ncbi:GTP-binding protein SAR1 [Nematocida homosporus]|uniref:GTP-binding protein SAR1 n=1 Tax=Nematocida homosporus TaxID=1912981 RepID=UPI00221EFD73|nr:GTP-binding protein SAR1 [Nematocida homosporus]KAI5187782.1 GTP-binding protein SAR1 [Nematocida homosporus]
MGSVLSRCLNRKKRSVIIIGAADSGKTQLIQNMKKDKYMTEKTTSIYEQHLIRAKGYALDLFDLSGDPKHSQFWKFYTESSHLVVFVVDVSSKEKIVQSKEVFESFYTSYCMQKENLIFILNKIEEGPQESRDEMISMFHDQFQGIFGVSKRLTHKMLVVNAAEPRKALTFICKSLKQ